MSANVSIRSSPRKVGGLDRRVGGASSEAKIESELDTLRRANAELQAWVRDLLEENRYLRNQVAEQREPEHPPPPQARMA